MTVILAGSSGYRFLYPSVTSWQSILGALSAAHPQAVICLIGKLKVDRRTATRIDRNELDHLLGAIDSACDCFDRPLLEQIALIEASDLVVAPHTGLALAASAVGTPWLAISGGHWHEYFFNGEPVYSLVPDTNRYPCFFPRLLAAYHGDRARIFSFDNIHESYL